MNDTKVRAIFHHVKEINNQAAATPCGVSTPSAYLTSSALKAFLADSAFSPIIQCFAWFYHQLIKCKAFLSYSFRSYF